MLADDDAKCLQSLVRQKGQPMLHNGPILNRLLWVTSVDINSPASSTAVMNPLIQQRSSDLKCSLGQASWERSCERGVLGLDCAGSASRNCSMVDCIWSDDVGAAALFISASLSQERS
jgi:hypothetical protein